MNKHRIHTLLSQIGDALQIANETATIEIYGSAVLVLGYPCWSDANDIDARWHPYEDAILWPIIQSLVDHDTPTGWLNNDIADITPEEGEWGQSLVYGGLTVKLPSEAYTMALLVSALEKCTLEPPHGKHAQKFMAFQRYLGWDKATILERCEKLAGPRGWKGSAHTWLDRLMPTPSNMTPEQKTTSPSSHTLQ